MTRLPCLTVLCLLLGTASLGVECWATVPTRQGKTQDFVCDNSTFSEEIGTVPNLTMNNIPSGACQDIRESLNDTSAFSYSIQNEPSGHSDPVEYMNVNMILAFLSGLAFATLTLLTANLLYIRAKDYKRARIQRSGAITGVSDEFVPDVSNDSAAGPARDTNAPVHSFVQPPALANSGASAELAEVLPAISQMRDFEVLPESIEPPPGLQEDGPAAEPQKKAIFDSAAAVETIAAIARALDYSRSESDDLVSAFRSGVNGPESARALFIALSRPGTNSVGRWAVARGPLDRLLLQCFGTTSVELIFPQREDAFDPQIMSDNSLKVTGGRSKVKILLAPGFRTEGMLVRAQVESM